MSLWPEDFEVSQGLVIFGVRMILGVGGYLEFADLGFWEVWGSGKTF